MCVHRGTESAADCCAIVLVDKYEFQRFLVFFFFFDTFCISFISVVARGVSRCRRLGHQSVFLTRVRWIRGEWTLRSFHSMYLFQRTHIPYGAVTAHSVRAVHILDDRV